MGKDTTPQFAFASLDDDGDGALRLSEFLQSRATAFSPPLSLEQAHFVFRGIDRNGDGFIDIREFAGVLGTLRWHHHAFRKTSKQSDLHAANAAVVTVAEFRKRMA